MTKITCCYYQQFVWCKKLNYKKLQDLGEFVGKGNRCLFTCGQLYSKHAFRKKELSTIICSESYIEISVLWIFGSSSTTRWVRMILLVCNLTYFNVQLIFIQAFLIHNSFAKLVIVSVGNPHLSLVKVLRLNYLFSEM